MLPPEVVRQIRRLHLKARRAVPDLLGGAAASVFKGAGLAFEEVREYQPGDDVRSIDWNVTARMGHPFIKRYVEEREQTVFLMIDASASTRFGSQRLPKREVAAELAALLAFSALQNNDRVGLILFTDKVERLLPPAKGVRHGLALIRDILFFEPTHSRTSLSAALALLNRLRRRRAIVFLLSDFLDTGYERLLRGTGRRHDVVAVRLGDPREDELPDAGLWQLEDMESGQQMLVDTASRAVREAFARTARERREAFRQLARAADIELIEVGTDGNHLDELVRFFRRRRLRQRTT
jgi:uncharacterized protein (DUF58 family)